MKYCSAWKREILTFATACMKLKDIMLNEIKQSQSDKYVLHDSTYTIYLKESNS